MKSIRRFPSTPHSVAGARHFLVDKVEDVSDETMDSLALIVSELAANCVQHAEMDFEVRVEQLPHEIRVEVEDHGPGDPVARSPDSTEASGRGLQIVGTLADEWGVTRSSGARGKTVWAIVHLPVSNERSRGAEHRSAESRSARPRQQGSRGTDSTGTRTDGRSSRGQTQSRYPKAPCEHAEGRASLRG